MEVLSPRVRVHHRQRWRGCVCRSPCPEGATCPAGTVGGHLDRALLAGCGWAELGQDRQHEQPPRPANLQESPGRVPELRAGTAGAAGVTAWGGLAALPGQNWGCAGPEPGSLRVLPGMQQVRSSPPALPAQHCSEISLPADREGNKNEQSWQGRGARGEGRKASFGPEQAADSISPSGL